MPCFRPHISTHSPSPHVHPSSLLKAASKYLKDTTSVHGTVNIYVGIGKGSGKGEARDGAGGGGSATPGMRGLLAVGVNTPKRSAHLSTSPLHTHTHRRCGLGL